MLRRRDPGQAVAELTIGLLAGAGVGGRPYLRAAAANAALQMACRRELQRAFSDRL
jgi:hypothetical protein